MMKVREGSVRYWDKRMAHRLREPLKPGDWVLVYNRSLESQWGKLFSNRWNGPYKIVEQVSGKSYVLEELDGTRLARRYAAAHVKRIFPRGEVLKEDYQLEEDEDSEIPSQEGSASSGDSAGEDE